MQQRAPNCCNGMWQAIPQPVSSVSVIQKSRLTALTDPPPWQIKSGQNYFACVCMYFSETSCTSRTSSVNQILVSICIGWETIWYQYLFNLSKLGAHWLLNTAQAIRYFKAVMEKEDDGSQADHYIWYLLIYTVNIHIKKHTVDVTK